MVYAMVSLSSGVSHNCGDQTGVARIISPFSCTVLGNSLPIKSKGGKEYGRRFFKFNKKVSTIHAQGFGYQLTSKLVGTTCKQRDMYTLDSAVSLFCVRSSRLMISEAQLIPDLLLCI